MSYTKFVEENRNYADTSEFGNALDVIEQQQAEIERLRNENQTRSELSPVDRLHNICASMELDRKELGSPYSQESWDMQDKANGELQKQVKTLTAEIERLNTHIEVQARVNNEAELSRLRKIEEAAKAHLSYMTPEEWRDHYGNNVFKSIVDGKLPTYFVRESPKGGK